MGKTPVYCIRRVIAFKVVGKKVGLEKGDQDMKIYFGSFLYPISFSPFFHREEKIISMIDLDVGSI